MSDKKLRYKLSPEVADGSSWSIVDTRAVALELIGLWFDNADSPAMEMTVQTVMMTDEEVDALPDL